MMKHTTTKSPALEVGQELVIDGRAYWIAKIIGEDRLELMPSPDRGRQVPKREGGFWSTFWMIVLWAILFRLIF